MKKSWQMLFQGGDQMKVYWYQWGGWSISQLNFCSNFQVCRAMCGQASWWRLITPPLWRLEHLLRPQKLITPWTSGQGQFAKWVPMLNCHSCVPVHMSLITWPWILQPCAKYNNGILNFNIFAISTIGLFLVQPSRIGVKPLHTSCLPCCPH